MTLERVRDQPEEAPASCVDQENILGIQPINNHTKWRAAQAEKDDVIDLMSLFLQLSQQC